MTRSYLPRGRMRVAFEVRVRCASQAGGPRAEVVRGAVEDVDLRLVSQLEYGSGWPCGMSREGSHRMGVAAGRNRCGAMDGRTAIAFNSISAREHGEPSRLPGRGLGEVERLGRVLCP
jgi:hypothetical protein